ncbi:MAG: hypothetical protein COT73_01670 [Bdellovibrio sp. CG10_big_fil_rev_8_21_14_0_10_47_8]|nr:MAG: hypothetical protein COT73_01670 [Bdellovibrio sp. CG10_big_fil_rev_8_21_14_0_10_47_8]
MVQKKLFFVFSFLVGIALAFFSHAARADILFEGYSKVLSGGVHIGYAIARYEFDNKKKQFIATTFVKTNEFGGNLSESLKSYSTDDMKPISYQYTTLIGKQVKTIDAKFEKGKILATVKDGDKVEKIVKDLPKGAFLSSFLAYVMLRSPTGLKIDAKYDYQAIAEEDAAISKGIAFIKSVEDFNGMKAFRVLNEFKSVKFVSLINDKGEVYSTKSPVQGIATELVAKPSEATNNMSVPTATLRVLFGDVPTGQFNEISKKAQASPPAPTPPTPPPGKQQGFPAGKGIQIKGGTPPPQEKGH